MALIAIRDVGGGEDTSSPAELDLRDVQNGQDIDMLPSATNTSRLSRQVTKAQYTFNGSYYDDNNGLGSCTFTCKAVNVSQYNSLTISAAGMSTVNNIACSVLNIVADGSVIASYSNGAITNQKINIQGKKSLYFQVYQRAVLWKPKDQNGDAVYESRYVNITKALLSKTI